MKKTKLFKDLYVLVLDGHILTPDSFKEFWKNYGGNHILGWHPPKKIYYTLGTARAGLAFVPKELRDKVEIHKFSSQGVIQEARDSGKSQDFQQRLVAAADRARERVSKYTPEEREELEQSARRTMKHTMQNLQVSIGKKAAIEMGKSKWWERENHRTIAEVQLFTKELCVPIDVFQRSLEKCLGRPVFTHELGLNYDGIVREFLGHAKPPTLNDIINLIPEDKRMLIE